MSSFAKLSYSLLTFLREFWQSKGNQQRNQKESFCLSPPKEGLTMV